jgi:hypothetical protein
MPPKRKPTAKAQASATPTDRQLDTNPARNVMGDAFDRIALETGRSKTEVMECYSERAAIREYLGGMTRLEAELRAVDDTRAMLAR